MNLDLIKNNTKWEDAANSINSNFNKTNLELIKIAASSVKHKGYFTTEAALLAAQPSPKVGDNAYVGATYPGVVYICNTAGMWTATTTVPSPPAVNISEYYKKTETDAIVATVESNINSLETDVSDIDSMFMQTNNIYDPSGIVVDKYITPGGSICNATGWAYCIQGVLPDTQYVIRNPNFEYVGTIIGGVQYLEEDGTFISGGSFQYLSSIKNGKLFTTPSGCTKIAFNIKNATGTIDFVNKMEIYVGADAVPDTYNSPRTLRDLFPLFDTIYNAAKQEAITEVITKKFFTQDSLFTNIEVNGIVNIESSFDTSRIIESGYLYLWYISNGGEGVDRTIYIAQKVNDVFNSGTIVSAYIGDSIKKTDVERVRLSPMNGSGVEFFMTVDWSKINTKGKTEDASTDTILDLYYINKKFKVDHTPKVYKTVVTDPTGSFIANIIGDVINTPRFDNLDFDWDNGIAYGSNGNILNNPIFSLSQPKQVIAGDKISAPLIPSLSYSHAFIDDNGTVIQTFGQSSELSWANPKIMSFLAPSGATRVRFSWYNNSEYWDDFYVTGLTGIDSIYDAANLVWENGYSYNTSKREKIVTAVASVSNIIMAKSLFIEVTANDISATTGIMCYDENMAPLGVVPAYNESSGTLITVRLLNYTKYVSFSYTTSDISTFTCQFTSGVLYTNSTGLSFATVLNGTTIDVYDIAVGGAHSRIRGKNGISFGDSITWYDGQQFTNTHTQEGQIAIGYQSYLRDEFECSIQNLGASGHTMPTIYNNRVLPANYTDIDFVTLTSGANDARLGVPIGTVADIGSVFDTSTFAGAMQAAIEYILAQNNHIIIFLLTPIKGWFLENGTGSVPGSYPDIPLVYPDIIKEIGSLYSLPVIDMYSNVFINEITRPIYIGDKDMWGTEPAAYYLHPTNLGFKMMGEYICKQIATFV